METGAHTFAPTPPGGAMVKSHWIKRYQEFPPKSEQYLTLQSWDTASKGGPDNDWSVCTTWIVTRDKRWYLIDVWRRRVDYPALKAARSISLGGEDKDVESIHHQCDHNSWVDCRNSS